MTIPTPALMARPRPTTGRRQILLAAIRTRGGRWTTGRVKALYRTAWPTHVYRSNVRGDLGELRDLGFLSQHLDEGGHRYFLYIPIPTGGAS